MRVLDAPEAKKKFQASVDNDPEFFRSVVAPLVVRSDGEGGSTGTGTRGKNAVLNFAKQINERTTDFQTKQTVKPMLRLTKRRRFKSYMAQLEKMDLE